jgi:predicted metal-dependent hydrolase
MSTEQHAIQVRGIKVQVVRKAIKNLHLGVYPPDGRVRIAAPLAVSDDALRLAVIGKLAWINCQRIKFARQPRESKREMVSGESHYLFGRRYRLRVLEQTGRPLIRGNHSTLELVVRRGTGAGQRQRILEDWYRERLREAASPLLRKWQRKMGVEVAEWGIKKMKTKWGACNAAARRVWLNLELAKAPPECLEYIVVHELVHFLVRPHDERFHRLMEQQLPGWRGCRQLLNSVPLSSVRWVC